MSTLKNNIKEARASKIKITEEELIVFLDDGRTITVPLSWYPRLLNGTRAERNTWHFIGEGIGIHWPDLDEDISIEGLIEGIPSQESQSSLKNWLKKRNNNE
jgi:hypothetical protein